MSPFHFLAKWILLVFSLTTVSDISAYQLVGTMGDLKQRYLDYCKFGRPDATDMTNRNFVKMCEDKGLMDGKLNPTEVDMIFTRAKGGPANKTLTFATFQTAIKMMAKSKYGDDSEDNVERLKGKILEGSGPSLSGTTETSTKGNVEHFNDASKGKAGRDDVAAQDGYIQGYKQEDTYDAKH